MRSDCLLWQGPTRNGYGWDGTMYAHGRAWVNAGGELLPGFELHHECEEPLCVNVEHLELVTRRTHARLHGFR